MNNERVELINAGFKTFNEAHSIDSGIGYFVDRDGSTVFAFHEVTDQHVMHLMASLVLKMAEKCEADPKAIIGAQSIYSTSSLGAFSRSGARTRSMPLPKHEPKDRRTITLPFHRSQNWRALRAANERH